MGLLIVAFIAALAGLACLRASTGLPRLRLVWRWLGIACLAWAGGATASVFVEALGARDPAWLLPLVWLAFVAVAFRSALPLLRDRTRDREAILDGLMIAVAVSGGAVQFLVMPQLEGGAPAHQRWLSSLWQLSLCGLAVLSITGLVWCRRKNDRVAFLTLLGGSALPVIVNAFGNTADDQVRAPAGVLDALAWSAGFALIVAGAAYARRHRSDSLDPSAPPMVRFWRYASLPVIAIGLQVMFSLPAALHAEVDLAVRFSRVAMGLLIAVRLYKAANLSERLHARTQERNRLLAVVDLSAAIVGASDTESLLRHIGTATARSLDRSTAHVTYRPNDGAPCSVWIGDPSAATAGSAERHPLLERRNPGLFSSRAPFVATVDDDWLPSSLADQWRRLGKWEVLVVPMTTDRELLGHLEVWSPFERGEFPSGAVATAIAVVHEGTLAIQNARLIEETHQRGNERALLLHVSQAAASSLELSTVLAEIAQATLGVPAIEASSIELWDPASEELVVAAQATISAWPGIDPNGTRFSVDRWPKNREALERREPVHLTVESPGLADATRNELRALGVGSALLFPLFSSDERLGLLKVFSRKTDAFGAAEIRLGQEMSNQTALAIHNARLLEEERQRAEERAVLLRVSKASTSSLDLHTVLGEIAESTLGIAGIECTAIELWHPDTDELEIAAQRTIREWPGIDEPGTCYPITLWEQDRPLLARRELTCLSLSDPELDEAQRRRMIAAGTGTLLVFPLWAGDQCLGLLDFFSRTEGAFGDDAHRLGAEIASTTALAIQNARLLAAEQNRANEWAILHRVSRAAIAGHDKQTVLTDIAHACLGIGGTECCTVFSWVPGAAEVVLEADVTIPDWPGTEEPGTHYPLEPGMADFRAMAERKPVILDFDDPELNEGDRAVMVEHGMRSVMVIPIFVSDENTGLLNLSSRKSHAFDEDSVRLGMEIGAQTALALRNAQLLEETRRYADEQSALLRVSRALSGGGALDAVMDEIALASLTIAGAECCEIEILHLETDETEMIAGQHLPEWPHGQTPIGKRMPLGDWPVTRRAIDSRQPEIIETGSQALTEHERASLLAGNRSSLLIVPMVVDERCLGVMCYYARTADAFTKDSVRLGLDLAGQAAIALERARLHAALKEQANTDGLTGLLNHRAIHERLDQELARAHRDDEAVAILMVDLNRFKYVNDTYGHQAGDIVLKGTAAVLRASVRAYDVVGRYGGDEFMVILPGTDAVDAISVADRIVANAAGARLSGPLAGLAINLSVGLAVFPGHASTRQELIDVADRAMYRAKHHRVRQALPGDHVITSVAD